MKVQNYMKGEPNKKLQEGLRKVLSDTFVLYFKTHSFHWNVEGKMFKTLHDLFEEQYTELWQATDEIAERIRMLGGYAPNNYTELLKDSSLAEMGQTPDSASMTKALAEDNREIVNTILDVFKVAQDAGDEGTMDMMVERTKVHEKAAWMLESITE